MGFSTDHSELGCTGEASAHLFIVPILLVSQRPEWIVANDDLVMTREKTCSAKPDFCHDPLSGTHLGQGMAEQSHSSYVAQDNLCDMAGGTGRPVGFVTALASSSTLHVQRHPRS